MENIPEANRKRTNPPILFYRFGKESLDWNPYQHAEREDSVTPMPTPKMADEARKVFDTASLTTVNKYEALVKQLDEVAITLTDMECKTVVPKL